MMFVVCLVVLKMVSTAPVGIGKALCTPTSFGPGPCMSQQQDPIAFSPIVNVSALAAKPILLHIG